MEKERILEILYEWNFWKKELDAGIIRKTLLESLQRLSSSKQITIVTGARRAGKSTLLIQYAKMLIENGIPKESILYVNFEDPRFIKADLNLLTQIYETYRENINPKQKPYIFFDEIQKVYEWEKFARALHEKKEAQIFVSGSNSEILSAELGTILTGRHLDLTVFPLSFKEFLIFKGINLKDKSDYITQKVVIKNAFFEYLEYGGFPKIVLDKENKVPILKAYFDDTLMRDVIVKNNIKESENLRAMAVYYFSNASTLHSINSLRKFIKLSNDTLDRFASYLQSAYLLFFVSKFSYSLKEQSINPKKVYLIDSGLKNAVGFRFREELGKLMENLIFLELKREGQEVYYWKDRYGYEVDFVIKEGLKPSKLIQSCWNISDPKTKEREVRGLLRGMIELNISKGIIITEDYEGEELVDGKKIIYVSILKWLLKNTIYPPK